MNVKNVILKVVVAVSVIFTLSSTPVSAYSVVSSEKTYGVIDKINASLNTIEIIDESTGEVEKIPYTDLSLVITEEGISNNVSSLKEGQKVIAVTSTVKKLEESIQGKIVSINHDKFTIRLRDKETNKVLKVKFNEYTLVKGLGEKTSFNDLRKGQNIVAQYVKSSPKNNN